MINIILYFVIGFNTECERIIEMGVYIISYLYQFQNQILTRKPECVLNVWQQIQSLNTVT